VKLLEKITIESMELKNRMAFPPITTAFGAVDGCFTDIEIAYMIERARGGAALVFTDGVAVDREHQLSVGANLPYFDDDRQISNYTRYTDALRNEGVKTCIQLYHAGRQTTLAKRGGKEPIAPSVVPTKMLGLIPFPDAVEMTKADIERAIRSFVLAASRAKTSGFDAVDIDGGAGYLIQQFMSPYTNERCDEWGGTFDKRMRFALEIVSRVREVVGKNYPLVFDLPMDEYVPGGITPDGGVRIALALEEAGINAFRVHGVVLETYNRMFPTMATPRGVNAPLGAMLKNRLRAKVMLGQRINDSALAEKLLQDGACDIILLGRALLADPDFPEKVKTGRSREIRKCLACNTCVDQLGFNKPIRCAINARLGFEREYRIKKTGTPKTILVAGGGPAGMEAARVAAMAGHRVVLCEKKDALGGQLLQASVPPHKEELSNLVEYLAGQMEICRVDVRLKTMLDKELVRQMKPDAVILTTGAVPLLPPFPGADGKQVFFARDVIEKYNGIEKKKVLIVGGGSVGAETAELLWSKGNKVVVLEMLDTIAADMGLFISLDFHERIRNTDVMFITGAWVKEIRENGAVYEDASGAEHFEESDLIVLAAGYVPDLRLTRELDGMDVPVVIAGDAVRARNIMNAVHEGFHAARILNENLEGRR
jgi:2,4-dienoyl-CoA reductase-like NADH-dependent reductase (Old Yellow Enzyme family)/thioredoxin reductase